MGIVARRFHIEYVVMYNNTKERFTSSGQGSTFMDIKIDTDAFLANDSLMLKQEQIEGIKEYIAEYALRKRAKEHRLSLEALKLQESASVILVNIFPCEIIKQAGELKHDKI